MTFHSTLQADDVLDMLDTSDSVIDSDDKPYQGFVLSHPELGVFVGLQNAIAYWSGLNSGGSPQAVVFFDAAYALETLNSKNLAGNPERADDVEVFAVPSGHWKDLIAIGLDVGDMWANEPAYAALATATIQ